MRLTKNFDNKFGYELLTDNPDTSIEQDISNAIQKLGRLEDIEELCEKLLETKTYFTKITKGGEIYEHRLFDYKVVYNFKNKYIEFYDYEFVDAVKVEDYGKTWALTKEELK